MLSPAKDTLSHRGTETAGDVAMTTADTVAAAAFFDAVKDSDSSASSDILQMNQVSLCYLLFCMSDLWTSDLNQVTYDRL